MDIKNLEGKTIAEMTQADKDFLRHEYMRYFDTLNPRNRAIGYCVVCGGIPQMKIGLTDFFFWKNKGVLCQFRKTVKDLPYALMFEHVDGNRRIFNADLHAAMAEGGESAKFAGVLWEYIKSDGRFYEAINGEFDKSSILLPAFVPLMNSKYDRLDSCKTLMAKANLAIGYDSTKIACHRLASVVYAPQFAAIEKIL